MKRQVYISSILSLILLFSVSSCQKDEGFLDKSPNGVLSTTNFYKTAADAEAAVNACYTIMMDFWMESISFKRDIMSDDAVKGQGVDLAALSNFDNLNFSASDGVNQTIWNLYFKGIYLTNLVLDYVPGIEMDAAQKDRILGEAHFLRGFYYYNLIIRFGGVPVINSTITADIAPAREKTEASWAFVEEDLTKAAELLPWRNQYSSDNLGRADKGASLALLGSAYLFQEKWQNAFDSYQQVIASGNYSLLSNFGDLFKPEFDNGVESVFEIQFRGGEEFSYGNGFNFWVRPRNGSTIFGLGFCMPTQDLVDEFEVGDPRLRYTVIREGDIISEEVKDFPFQAAWAPETGMSCGKYVVDVLVGSNAERHEQNLKQIRYADVLLGYAEAALRLGNGAEAVAKINLVRQRARIGNAQVLPDLTGSEDLFTALVHERRVELALEGKRYFDLVRWGLAEQELGTLGYQPARKGLYPIPQAELDVNPNLKQNIGY